MLLASLVSLMLLAGTTLADTLLPETPEGWSFERLDFPLSFAPELDYEGFEELRFAPGMFDADSPSHFSYVLAIRLEQDLDVDERFLEGLLQKYYSGLCRAVAASNQLDLDLDAITTSVSFDGRDFVATVQMFDVFVTAEPLTLRIEVSVRAGARATELLGIASPKPRDAPIWNELDDIRRRWRASRAAPVLLNHFYIVPDAETYAALAASEYLRSGFGVNEVRTTKRTDMTYTGLYFYGDNTYFEFLAPSSQFLEGSSGVCFGFELEGGAAAGVKQLDAHGLAARVDPITREFNGKQVPWFRMLSIFGAEPGSKLNLFGLEYDPRFLESWYSDQPPTEPGISRRGPLERYAAKLGQTAMRHLAPLQDVSSIQLELSKSELARLVDVCTSFGYVIDEADGQVVCDGPGVQLVAREVPVSRGVTGMQFRLRRPVQREPMTFGRAQLSFSGRAASFELRP